MKTPLSLLITTGGLVPLFMGLASGCGTDEVSRGPGKVLEAGTDTGTKPTPERDTGTSVIPGSSRIGRGCTKDSDCGSGLSCLAVTSNELAGGGPPGGMCTADCTADRTGNGLTDTCGSIDPATICLGVSSAPGGKAYCFQQCALGPTSLGETKCNDRVDFGCVEQTASNGQTFSYCSPSCRNDADCGGKRQCDLGSGICVDEAPAGDPIGAKCKSGAASPTCAGFCLVDGDNSFCSANCIVGAIGCGYDPTSKDPPAAACIYAAADGSYVGDQGFCAPICDCDDDCTTPGFVCSPVRPNTYAELITGMRAGTCVPAIDREGGVVPRIACSGKDGGTAPNPDAGELDSGASEDAGRD